MKKKEISFFVNWSTLIKNSNLKPSYLNAYDGDGRDNDGRSCGDDVLKPKRNDFMS